jgi:hypothetical protein
MTYSLAVETRLILVVTSYKMHALVMCRYLCKASATDGLCFPHILSTALQSNVIEITYVITMQGCACMWMFRYSGR